MITVGRLAEQYGQLPHQVEQNATTYDLMIMDVLATYDNYMEQKNKRGTVDPKTYKFTQEELQKLLHKKK